MNRPIKFRAWDMGKMFGHALVGEPSNPSVWSETKEWLECTPDAVLMQFTNLLDKNGKEIYEGDILLDSNWGMQNEGVFFNVDHGAFYSWWKYANPTGEQRKDVFSGGYFGSAKASTSEVIGNIYENPSLITSKETKEN